MAVDLTSEWAPLERRLPAERCADFMWMFHENGVEHYKHIVTRRYLRLHQDGRCLAWTQHGLKEVPFEQEWRRVSGRAGGCGDDATNS